MTAAKAIFADWGVDTEAAMARAVDNSDLRALLARRRCGRVRDAQAGTSGGGIQATGNHPGRARTPDELRADLEFAYAHDPGQHRLNLHACYLDTDETPDRDEIEYRHFAPWVDWAQGSGAGA